LLIKSEEIEFHLKNQDPIKILNKFISIINRTGATVINCTHHIFPNNALSAVILIMESHAAIHTWPEDDKVWVGFFTCGDLSQIDKFKLLIKGWEIMSKED
jgi:S-adenosylmethionine/arginine decarboxylase-like enzyme